MLVSFCVIVYLTHEKLKEIVFQNMLFSNKQNFRSWLFVLYTTYILVFKIESVEPFLENINQNLQKNFKIFKFSTKLCTFLMLNTIVYLLKFFLIYLLFELLRKNQQKCIYSKIRSYLFKVIETHIFSCYPLDVVYYII